MFMICLLSNVLASYWIHATLCIWFNCYFLLSYAYLCLIVKMIGRASRAKCSVMFECQTHHLSLPCRCLSRTCKAFVVAPNPRAQHRLLTALALRQEPPDLVARCWWRTQASPLLLDATTHAASVPDCWRGELCFFDDFILYFWIDKWAQIKKCSTTKF